MIKMGIFIHDLHLNIKQIHLNQNNNDRVRKFTVYRGQGMPNKDFQKVKNGSGNLLSFNNFLSTSNDRDVSLMFAQSAAEDENLVGILFQMEIDESVSSVPFACINDVTQFQSENETLFSMNTIFRIREIQPLNSNNRLWQVNLTITSDTDRELTALTDHLRRETEHATGWARLIPLLLRLNEFEKAKQLCEMLLTTEIGRR